MILKDIKCRNSYRDHEVELSLIFDDTFQKDIEKLADDTLGKIGKKILINIKQLRKKRSLNANAYFWVLLNDLAIKLDTTVDELYKRYVREYGVSQLVLVPGNEEAKTEFIKQWGRGHDSTGWFAEDFGKCIRVFFGTSTYDSKQMARIIQAVIDDCKAAGINTLTPDEVAHMVSVLDSN